MSQAGTQHTRARQESGLCPRQVHGTHVLDKRVACVPGRYTTHTCWKRGWLVSQAGTRSPYFPTGAGEEGCTVTARGDSVSPAYACMPFSSKTTNE